MMHSKNDLIRFYAADGVASVDFPMGSGYIVSMVAVEPEAREEGQFEGDIIVLHNDEEITSDIFDMEADIRPTVNNLHAVLQHVSNHIKLTKGVSDESN